MQALSQTEQEETRKSIEDEKLKVKTEKKVSEAALKKRSGAAQEAQRKLQK